MKKTRVAVIGLGDMGAAHVKGFDALEEAEVAAVCDCSDDAADRALKPDTGCRPVFYADYRELLADRSIEAVAIAVPGYLHEQVALDCIKAGKHILLEKPVAIEYASFRRVKEAAERSGLVVQVGLVYRYSHLYRTMAKKLREDKELGNVTLAWCKEFRQCFPQEDWFYDEKKSGGAIVEKNCHHFDIFNWMIGSRPRRVFAMGGQHVYKNGAGSLVDCSYSPKKPRIIDDISIVDHAFVITEYENGAKANLGLCLYLKPMNLSGDGLEIGFIGDNGKQLTAKRDELFIISGGEYGDRIEYRPDIVSDNKGLGHIGCQQERLEFIKCVQDKLKPSAGISTTEESLLIAFAAERSIKEGRAVSVDEFR